MKNFIPINEGYRLSWDSKQFIIQTPTVVKDSKRLKDKSLVGTTIWKDYSFHPTLSHVVRALLDYTSLDHISDLKSLAAEIDLIKAWAENILRITTKEAFKTS